MSFFTMARGPRTLLAGLMLAGIYLLYARLTSPWLSAPQFRIAVSQSAPGSFKSPEFGTRSRDWFPEDKWVADAGKKFRDGQRYLFFERFRMFNDNRSMQVEPVAMAWESDDPSDDPITISAASAQLDRSEAFELAEQEFGRITDAHLAGDVYIRGPDGLRITGRNFYVSEKAMMIWSSQPVDFMWQDHQGRAEGGVEIQLLSEDNASTGLMSVSDVHSIRMIGRVTCSVVLRDRDQKQEATRLRINAARSFEYNVATRLAVFSGYEDREAIPENQILVEHPNRAGSIDKLLCTQLSLMLKPRINGSAEPAQRTRRLELHSILAEGSRVVVWLAEQKVQAIMTSLRYTIDENLVELWHNKTDADGRPFPVEIRQDGSEVFVPRILVFHGDASQIHSLECLGPGIIRHKAGNEQDGVEATWLTSLRYRSLPESQIELDGNVQVARSAQQFQLQGEHVEMLLESQPDTSDAPSDTRADENSGGRSDAGTSSSAAVSPGSLNFSRLKPRRLSARDNVRLTAPQISGTARQELTVTFVDGHETPPNADRSDAAAGTEEPQSTASSSMPNSGFTNFVSDTLEATLTMHRGTRRSAEKSELSDVWLKGSVEVDHTAVDPEQSFSASGNVLYARGGIVSGRDISLFGDPAAIVSTTRRIEGQRIELSELAQEFRVEGSGRIRFVVDTLFGEPLEKPSPLDIYWTDRMRFQGRAADFIGKIRTVMKDPQSHDLEMTCDGMKVYFVNDGPLQKSPKASRSNILSVSQSATPGTRSHHTTDIEKIECRNLVQFRGQQMKQGVLESIGYCQFSDLVLNLQTGDFQATGPGRIETTHPDRGNTLKASPGVTVRSNAPVRASTSPYVFIRADFIGSISGNMNQQVVRLSHHVVGVFGPVRRLGDQIDVNEVNTAELPPQAGILRCEQLTASAIPGPQPDKRSFSLLAETKARLELRDFSGEADRITYDHAKEQYILRSEQDHIATVAHRPGAGRDLQRFYGQKFEYYPPPRNKLTVNQITGLDGLLPEIRN